MTVASIYILYKKPDYRFILKNTVNHLFNTKDIPEKISNLDEYSFLPVYNEARRDDSDTISCNNNLVLINKENPINNNPNFEIKEYKNTGILTEESLMEAYSSLNKAVKENTGDKLYIFSGYRTQEEQENLYSEDNKIAALPGASEHESGLALDLYVKYFAGNGFLKTKAGQFVNSNSYKFGFIIRYPAFKKHITGIVFESWHIRYVGLPHSEIIYKNNLVLEEYLELFQLEEFYRWGDYIISKQSPKEIMLPENIQDVSISPDNLGNYIITGILKD